MMITKNKIESTFSGLFLLAIVMLTLSCKKENSTSHEPATATILLTQKSWTLASYGYDRNANGLIDASEEVSGTVKKITGIVSLWEEMACMKIIFCPAGMEFQKCLLPGD